MGSPTSWPAASTASGAAQASSAFVYFVAVTGVTGARRGLPAELPSQLRSVRERTGAPARSQAVGDDVVAVDRRGARIRLQHGIEHA